MFLTAGCSAFKPAFYPKVKIAHETEDGDLLKSVKDQNVTLHNFFVQKAHIEINSNTLNESFLASIKYVFPDTFLISLRSKTGIEAARIFFTDDTILINDRINRKLLFGKPVLAGRKYGLTPEIFPLILGDLVSENSSLLLSDCINGQAVLNSVVHGSKIKYVLDCEKGKVVSAMQEGSFGNILAMIGFDRFIRDSDILFPSRININLQEYKVAIRIENIEYPWTGNIEFIPGKNYELIELL